ncbi:hypothetical protein [Pseudomonas delhiensis]|uniref:hypothetical protein n=1 Tax=Pseudomonas delhiensis TaxID=366289 RepID=UPI003159C33C
MNSHPTFDVGSLSRLAERTEYEIWLLEAVYALVEQELFPSWPDTVVYPVDKSQAQFFGYGRINIVLGDWRPSFLNASPPLVFVSTFKLLDMFIEWILEENGVPSTFRFQQKLQHLKGSPIFPQTIETRPWLKERLIGLYSILEPLRGTIIHDKHFSVTGGAIQISSSRKGIVGAAVEISAANLRMLAVTIVSVLRYVDGNWYFDELREKILRYELDELVTLHGLPLLGQKRPFHTCVRVYLEGPDPLDFNPMVIQGDLAARYVDQDCSFDLRVLMVKGGEVVDAYLFPWALISVESPDWRQVVDAQQYRAALPDDIKPEHLGTG